MMTVVYGDGVVLGKRKDGLLIKQTFGFLKGASFFVFLTTMVIFWPCSWAKFSLLITRSGPYQKITAK